jgi:ElaB/YqjD/DUF883 family membrane-anchored ribosome-binding protein
MNIPADKPDRTVDALVSELRALVAEAETLLGQAAVPDASVISGLAARVASARDRLAACCASARDRVVEGARVTDTTIRAHPYESLAVALGIGVLLGALVARRPRGVVE